jgi:hypothetical protein
LLYIFVFLFIGTSFSQENKFIDKFSFGMSFKLPKTIQNTTFKKTMYGIGDLDAQFNYKLIPNIEFSLGYKYGYYDVNSVAFQSNIDGQFETHLPFIKLSYIKDLSDRMFVDFGVRSGYNFSSTKTTNCSTAFLQNAFRIEPELGVYMLSTDLLSFGLVVSYNIWFNEFSPQHFCVNSISGMNPSESVGIYQTFCAGFSFKTYFPERSRN